MLARGETFDPLAAVSLPVTLPLPLSVCPLASTNVPLVSPVTSSTRVVSVCTSIAAELAMLFVNEPERDSVPPLIVVVPVKVLAPERVVVPPVLCVRPFAPARIALTEPL